MFKRLILEDWSSLCISSFILFMFAVFCVMIFRAMLMGGKQNDHLAMLPLESSKEKEPPTTL